ncbi:MAG: carbohydrate ABC transporter permease [Treponema sp.]|nr:carbohydrate ABC transporter permease [Treponema sp.]
MKRSRLFLATGHAACVVFCVILMYPLGVMISKSLRNNGLGNYLRVFREVDILPNFRTSVLVVFGTMFLVAMVTSMAAFAFSKLNFPGKKLIYFILLSAMMIPTAAILFPLFFIVRGLRLINSPWALIFPYVTLNAVFNLLILKNFFDSFPRELMEAATIDGANTFGIYFRIMMPISVPGLSIVLIQTFLAAWNELQMGMTFINRPRLQPISVVPLRFVQTVAATYPIEVMYASLVICLLPIALFYIGAQKFLIKGLSAGAIKG